MQAGTAQERLLDRTFTLSPEQFEVLCKLVLAESLRTSTLTVTPASQDGGIDIEGRLDYDWFAANYGVQVKQYAVDNRVGNDRVHRLAGALAENDYHLGTFVTTSSYTRPAIEAAGRLPIQLVGGADLAQAMVEREIGVERVDDRYEFDGRFWESLAESDESVPSSEVPLGSNRTRIRAVLQAMRHTNGTWDEIRRWVAAGPEIALSKRHVYINANSATILGLARKEPATGNRDVQHWGLTAMGAEFVSTAPGSPAERRVLAEAVRSVDLVRRILDELEAAGELTADEIDDHVERETTGLSEGSVERRASSVRSWLAVLPEIRVEDSRSGKTYVFDAEHDGQSELEWFDDEP